MDANKVKEKQIEYVLALRSILREISGPNRTQENLEAVAEIETALNSVLMDNRQETPSLPGLVHA